jgi:hypothetical protein
MEETEKNSIPNEATEEGQSNHRDLQECDKERDSAYDVLNRDQAEYDKQILTLSATFLGVSVAFVKDIVPLDAAVAVWSYDCAVCMLFTCVVFVLVTYQYSIHGHFWLINYWDKRKEYLSAEPQQQSEIQGQLEVLLSKLSSKAARIRMANCISGILFATAVLFLVGFVVVNIHHSSSASKGGSMAPSNGSEFNKLVQGGDCQRGANLKMPAPAPQSQPSQAPAQPAQPQTGGSSNGGK